MGLRIYMDILEYVRRMRPVVKAIEKHDPTRGSHRRAPRPASAAATATVAVAVAAAAAATGAATDSDTEADTGPDTEADRDAFAADRCLRATASA